MDSSLPPAIPPAVLPPPAAAPAPPPKKRRGLGCLVAAGLSLLSLVGVAALVAVAFHFYMGADSSTDGVGTDEFPSMSETLSYGSGETKVIRIPVYGPIVRGDVSGPFSPAYDPVETALRMIRAATVDADVQAIILEVDSPGGGVTASDAIYAALLRFKAADPDRRIVALFGDVAASGGYYIAMASDHIVAHPTTITGSIGVLISAINLKGFGEKTGIRGVTIKSGDNKDLLNPFEDMNPVQVAILQKVVDSMRTRFVDLVATGRGLSHAQVDPIADGRIFTTAEAIELDLVDEEGYWEEAMAATREALGVDEIAVYRYEESHSLADFLRGTERIGLDVGDLFQSRARLQYMWQPSIGR